MPRPHSLSFFFCCLALLTLAGCLPSSCNRSESRALFPADSLSRTLAASTPVDTLTFVWETGGPEALPLAYPRTVLFDSSGRLIVSDAVENAIHLFDREGSALAHAQDNTFEIPFLAGIVGDTVAVFSPAERAVRLMVDLQVVHSLPTPAEASGRQQLQYAAYGPAGVYVKHLGEDLEPLVARLDARGAIAEQWATDQPVWRLAGKLVATGDTLLSACGYRPVLDRFLPGAVQDSLALSGFDSPMLARSRLFMLGELHDPPLLTPAFSLTGPWMFVLNIRPGWLWIDVYDRAGRLVRQLVQPSPSFAKEFYPVDLAAFPTDAGFDIAVSFVEPAPRVALYRWNTTH